MELTLDQALQQGIAAHREGKLQDAERLYRAILQAQPKHPDANHNLGVLAVAVGKSLEAIPLFKHAVEANPRAQQFWLSYVDALIREQEFENAKQVIEQAKKQGVDAVSLISLEARLSLTTQKHNSWRKTPPEELLNSLVGHYQNGRFSDAESLSVEITEEFPEHQFAWKVLGAVLGATGREAEALNANQTAVALAPQDAAAHSNLGLTLQHLGRLEEAETSYTQAIALKPDFAEAHNNLGITLKALGRFEEAETSYTQAIALKPDFADAHHNIGNTLKILGRVAEAEASYRQAIALKPDYAEAHSNLGTTLQAQGRLAEAKTSYTTAIVLKPDYAEGHRRLTLMKTFSVQDEQYSKMREIYLDKNISEEQRCHINFGLAKACEDLGDFKQAYAHYGEANGLRKKLLKYNIDEDLQLFRKITAAYPKIKRHSLAGDQLVKNLIPIFIVGMPRSGTTLVEQIVSSHSKVTGAGELIFAAQFCADVATGVTEASNESFVEFRSKYLEGLKTVSDGNLNITDKTPQNFRYLGLLTAAFPEAKIIHVKRNPAAVCWANYKQYFASKNIGYCYEIDDVIKYYKLYENLMAFWANTLSERVYQLDYEQLTVNQESETRQLVDYLGLDWDEKCLSPQNNMRTVGTASNLQVRKKVYCGSSEQWKRYRPFLKGALDGLPSP